jgi:hypothetical protein
VLLSAIAPLYGQDTKVLTAEKLDKLLPRKVEGFHLQGQSTSKQLTIGTLTYALCERTFAKGNKSIQILLFDYHDAPIMYTQAIRKWSEMKPVDTDSAVFRDIASPVFDHGWESYERSGNHSQFILGINSRFYLTISGKGMDLPDLRTVLNAFDFQRFPK